MNKNNIVSVLQVRWFKDGSEIRKGKKYEIIALGVQHILIIHKSMFDDEAEYECEAKASKSSGMLTVIGKSEHQFTYFPISRHLDSQQYENSAKRSSRETCKILRSVSEYP